MLKNNNSALHGFSGHPGLKCPRDAEDEIGTQVNTQSRYYEPSVDAA
jgi:hypothetical protein